MSDSDTPDRNPKEANPGDRSADPTPHHALNNPVGDPDPTEWPDPYERREDPRDAAGLDEELEKGPPHPPPGTTSTSEPHPNQDPQAEPSKGPKRDKVDQ